jgi:hypothetical protein
MGDQEDCDLKIKQRKWREDFIAFGGLDKLSQVFKDYKD